MGQDQEQRHVCRHCNENFSSGRVLGGHMNKNSAKGQKNVINSNMCFEGDGRTGYGLRENPKKSWKFSRSEHATSGQEIVCKVCGNGFESPRALCGHMRHHSGRQRIGIYCEECGKGFQSLRALTSHKRIHSQRFYICNESWTSSSLELVRKKRSNRMRYKIRPNSSFSSMNKSVSLPEIEKEVKDIAICLMMLSRGANYWGGYNSVTESSDNDSVTFEGKSTRQKTQIADNNANCKLINLECSKNSVEQDMSEVSLTGYEFKETKEHKCHICFMVFASGQALGGHKRAHLIRNSEAIAEETFGIKATDF
jgi:hypothetical protein